MECPWPNMHVAVLGCGFIGTAILKGLLNKTAKRDGGDPSVTYTAWVRSQKSLERLQGELGEHRERVHCLQGGDVVADVIPPADVVVLGFPPGELDSVFESAGGLADALRGKLIISLLAGVSYDQLATVLQRSGTDEPGGPDRQQQQQQHHVLRVIPSIGAKINDSITLIAEPEAHAGAAVAGAEQQKVTGWTFEQLGQTQWLPERLMNEATAAAAACNALTMVAVDAVVDASVAEGIPRPAAMKLAAASLRSSSGLLLLEGFGGGGMTPESLKESMSVPKGITINAVLELERGHVRSAVSDAVRHAIRYTRNMAA